MTCEVCHYATPVVRIHRGAILCPDCQELVAAYEEQAAGFATEEEE